MPLAHSWTGHTADGWILCDYHVPVNLDNIKKIKELAPTVQELEHLAAEYSSRPEEWLPEIGTLESAKSYRDKKIKPLLKEIVNVLHSLYVKHLTISNKYDRLETSYN